MALSYFKIFVWVVFPPPAVLLVLLLVLGNSASGLFARAIVSLCDAILFARVHPQLSITVFWFFFVVSAITFFDATQTMLSKQSEYYKVKGNVGSSPESLVKVLAAERNVWISGCALFLWVVLHRYRSLMKHCARLEANQPVSKKVD